MPLTTKDLDDVVKFIYLNSGITLDGSKSYLIESRLGPILAKEGISNYGELIRQAQERGALKMELIDAISTNETYFFRDVRPFDCMKNSLFPEIFQSSGRSIRVWSAACSTGQEAYSIGMLLKEILVDLSKHSIQIVGSDISESAILRASSGVYTQFELSRGLTPFQVNRYFKARGRDFQISEELRGLVKFRRENLLLSRGAPQTYNLILCRNVAIYFSSEDRVRLFTHMHSLLKRDGVLIIGATETIPYMNHLFSREMKDGAIYYRRRDV